MEDEFDIPDISDERINKYVGVAALKREGLSLYQAPKHDLRRTAWPWIEDMPKFKGKIKEKCRVRTLHRYGYYGFFKPSVAEVLAQLTDDQLEGVVAFEAHGPETADDLNRHKEELNAGFHVAETILYTSG